MGCKRFDRETSVAETSIEDDENLLLSTGISSGESIDADSSSGFQLDGDLSKLSNFVGSSERYLLEWNSAARHQSFIR
jgi:hypothetical protein